MGRIVYVNGRYVPLERAMVSVEDRGYQFSDGVYEVCEVRDGRLIDERQHLARLVRSLDELRMAHPMPLAALGIILREVVRRNRVHDGLVYVQVTRGVARRDHPFPPAGTKPALVVTARPIDLAANEKVAAEGIAVITLSDERWARVDIKSVSLLPNVLAKQAAREQGAREAWLVDRDGKITEGSSSNAWIVDRNGILITRSLDRAILPGITRAVLFDVIKAHGLNFEERAFTVEEAHLAREAFVTSATQAVMPVVRIDGRAIGNGAPGSIASALRSDYHVYAEIS
jgi:D-alanine transaminase